jgi:polyferredoxin
MSTASTRLVFSLVCALAAGAVLFGAWWELARFRRAATRGESSLPPRQLRLRLFSAVLWALIFAAFGYAVSNLWPNAAPRSP